MRLLIDDNILLDVLMDRKPFVKDSALIWKICEAGLAEGVVSAHSIANLFYHKFAKNTPASSSGRDEFALNGFSHSKINVRSIFQ